MPKRLLWRLEAVVTQRRDLLIVVSLMAVAVGLRLWMNRGLWLDEATTVAQAQMDFGRMLSFMRQSDVHPPMWQMIMWADIRVLGTSEFAVRLPSVIFGSLLVPALYATGRELFNRNTGLIAALVGAIGPAAIWYSQEARMYALYMLLATLTIWAQVHAVRHGGWKAWTAYTVVTAALLWTHYFSALHVMVQQLAFLYLIFQGRKTPEGKQLFFNWLRSAVGILLLVAPMAIIATAQIANYGERDTVTSASGVATADGGPIYTAISNIASAFVGYHSESFMTKINALWPLGMLVALLALGRGRSRVSLLLAALVVIPMSVLFVIGLERNDVFELRYFAAVVPISALFLGRSLTLISKRHLSMAFGIAAITCIMGIALFNEQRAGGNDRVYDFGTVLTAVNNEAQQGDLMLYEPFYLHPTVKYYAPTYTSYPLVTGLNTSEEPNRIVIVASLVFGDKERSEARLAEVISQLSNDRQLVEHRSENNIETWTFQ